MRITDISIDGFGLFDGRFELKLSRGVALIVGDNETGKSTIVRAITAILFGLGTENEKTAFAPYGTPAPRSGNMDIEFDGNRYRFSRDFASNRAKVEILEPDHQILFDGSAKPGGRTDEKETYDGILGRLLGIESRDLFQNSALVEQNSIDPEMKDVVRRIVSGSSTADYAVTLDNLRKVCEELSMELPWKKGKARKLRRIELLQSELDRKKQQFSEARKAGAGIEDLKSRLASVESRLTEISSSMESQKAWESALNSFQLAAGEKRGVEERLNACRSEIRDIEKLAAELKERAEKIGSEYAEYASLPEQAETDIAGLAQLRESKRELEERYRHSENQTAPIVKMLRFRFSAPIILAGILIVGMSAKYLEGPLRVAAIIAGVLLFIWPFISTYLSMRSFLSERQGKLDEMKKQMDSLKDQIAETEKLYSGLDLTNPKNVLNRLRELRSFQREMDLKKEALKQRPGLEEVQSKYNLLSNELVVVSKKVDDLKSQNPSLGDVEQQERIGAAIEEARAEISLLEKQLRELAQEKENLKLELARAEANEVAPEESLEEEISEMEGGLSRLKLNRDAHLLAIRVLEEAASEFRSSHLIRIEQKTSSYLGQITGTQCRVTLDEQLEPLGVEQAGRLFQISQLSQGVRDQLYFALRLAAVEEISGDTRLPLLLDDPFVNFDESRLKTTLQMLEKISQSHQVVLFTHDRRYCDWRQPSSILES